MPFKSQSRSFILAIFAIVSLILFATAIAVGEERVLHHFHDVHGLDGQSPNANLTWDEAGNLYGTTGGGNGGVFELMPTEDGGWTEKVLHSFGGRNGESPCGGLIWDAAGNLYGVTRAGGTHHSGGTVFELTPNGHGQWDAKVLHDFGLDPDGRGPECGLIWDAAGNLYGTTAGGGSHDAGIVFELTPSAGGSWIEKVLHIFGHGTDGQEPAAGLIWDAAGNLYGTTAAGGTHGLGTVFEMTPNPGGGWTEKVLHHFGYASDGQYPEASLTLDAAGNLYGTTGFGGSHSAGTAFELTPNPGGGWTEKVLHHFGHATDGQHPAGALIFDATGNLYGVTYIGGAHGNGTAFKLTPNADGGSTERVLHHFGYGADGQIPVGTLAWDANGNLYGSTLYGGYFGEGTVFEITP